MENNQKQTGKVNIVRALAAIYLLFLAFRMLRTVANGQTDMVAVSVVAALIFAAVGGYLAYCEWKAYRFGLEHKDDPETWNDDPDMLESAGEEPETELEETFEFEEEGPEEEP